MDFNLIFLLNCSMVFVGLGTLVTFNSFEPCNAYEICHLTMLTIRSRIIFVYSFARGLC